MSRTSGARPAGASVAATRSGRPWGFSRHIIDPDVSVGAKLAAARLKSGCSLTRLALATGVPARYLRAIEAENLMALPGLVYERHFIQRYARILGLESTTLVRDWAELRREPTAPGAPFVPRVQWRDLRVGPLVWRRALALLLVGLSVGYLGSQVVAMMKPPSLRLDEPPADLATNERTAAVVGATEGESTVTVNGQPVTTESDGSFHTVVSLEPGANTIRVTAAKRYGRPATVERQVFVVAPSSPAASTAATSALTQNESLFVP